MEDTSSTKGVQLAPVESDHKHVISVEPPRRVVTALSPVEYVVHVVVGSFGRRVRFVQQDDRPAEDEEDEEAVPNAPSACV